MLELRDRSQRSVEDESSSGDERLDASKEASDKDDEATS